MHGSIINRRCAVCHGNKKRLFYQQRFSALSAGSILDGYDVVICQDCGLCFADNLPDQAEFDKYYREMSKYEHQDQAGQPSEFERRQFPEIANFLAQIIPDPNANILEIGCANGGLLYTIKQFGYKNVLGIDPSPVCSRNAQQLYGIHVLTCPLSEVELGRGYFDFIILVAVLEHIHDLEGALTEIYDLLSPSGKLYVEVPDVTQFASVSDAPFQEFSVEHINFFSFISLSNLMNRYNFCEVYSTQSTYQQTVMHEAHALRMVFEKTKTKDYFKPIKDSSSQSALVKYIALSEKEAIRINQVVNKLVDNHNPLIVWGAGTHTQRLLKTSRLSQANIIAFVDSNPNLQDKRLNDIRILSPIELISINGSILISSKVFQSEIIHQIKAELKLVNEVITLYED